MLQFKCYKEARTIFLFTKCRECDDIDSIVSRQLGISKKLYKKRSINDEKDSFIGHGIHNVQCGVSSIYDNKARSMCTNKTY